MFVCMFYVCVCVLSFDVFGPRSFHLVRLIDCLKNEIDLCIPQKASNANSSLIFIFKFQGETEK